MSHKDLAAAFTAYDMSRRERAQWLIQGSRRNGDLVEWRTEDVGRDFNKIENEIKERCKTLWYADVNRMVGDAKEELRRNIEIQRRVQ
jgi:salicylate hydroxylase